MGSNHQTTNSESTNFYCDLVFDWRTETKNLFWTNKKFIFSFNCSNREKLGKTRFVVWWFDPMSSLVVISLLILGVQGLFQLNFFFLVLWTKRIVNVVITNTSLKKTRRSNSAICYGVVPNVWSTISIVIWGKTIFSRFDFSCPIWKAVLSIAVTLKAVDTIGGIRLKIALRLCIVIFSNNVQPQTKSPRPL